MVKPFTVGNFASWFTLREVRGEGSFHLFLSSLYITRDANSHSPTAGTDCPLPFLSGLNVNAPIRGRSWRVTLNANKMPPLIPLRGSTLNGVARTRHDLSSRSAVSSRMSRRHRATTRERVLRRYWDLSKIFADKYYKTERVVFVSHRAKEST